MNNQEAIEFLKNMIDREAIGFVCPEREGDVAIWQYHVEALQMAISALQAQDLPSAQPEIVRCKDCKYYREYGYVNGKPKFLPRCTFSSIYVNAVDFCSKAERRET